MVFDKFYIEHNRRRIKKIIDHFGHQAFFNKTVLDLGCGAGDIGGALARLGAQVTAVDVRQEHLTLAKRKYPHLTTICADLDKEWPFQGKKFDFVLNMGLICHLSNYEQLLRRSCDVAHNLIVESEICDSENIDRIIYVSEHRSIYDWAYNGVGYKPNAPLVEQILAECGMDANCINTPDLNSGPFKYDWVVENTDNRKIGHRRFWIATKLSNYVPPPQPPIIRNLNPPTISAVHHAINHASETRIVPQRSFHKNEKPRVAICLSGFLRTFDKNYISFLHNVLERMNADVFIHTWDTLGNPNNSNDNPVSKLSTASFKQKINTYYNPKSLIIEPIKHFNISPLMREKSISHDTHSVLCMYYKVRACNDLKMAYEKLHDFKYDCVIRCRTDLNFKTPFILNELDDFTKVYFPMYGDYGGYNDQFAFSSSEHMDIYSTVFNHIEDYLRQGIMLNPEALLKYHLTKNKLSIARSSVNYTIMRPNGSVQDNFELEKAFGFLPRNSINLLRNLPNKTPAISNLIGKNVSEMRVAVCLSGHLRTFQDMKHSVVHNLLAPTNADVFIHTWDTLGFDVGRGDGSSIHLKTSDYMQQIREIYNPKEIVIEDFFQQNKNKYTERIIDTRDPANVLGMFYKIKKCNDLKSEYEAQHNFKYDVVIRVRPDMRFDTRLYTLDFLNLKGNNIYLPKFDYHLGLNDKFAFGSSSTMDMYSECIDNIPMYYDNGCIFNAEAIMKAHIKHMRLQVYRCDLQYTLCKPDGFSFSNT